MKPLVFLLSLVVLAPSARADIRVFVEELSGRALLKYENSAGEVVRAFALDVSVNRGQIVGIAEFFRGESRPGSLGYGFFPASFRDHPTMVSGTNVNWEVIGYTPLAVVADRPTDTLPGLNSSGVTLEFAGLWDPAVPAAIPPPTGILCALELSEAAQVTLRANASRGGVVSASSESTVNVAFAGALVDPAIVITQMTLADGILTIRFKGGELETTPTIGGLWTGTGNTSGQHTEPVGTNQTKFYRVHRH